MNLEKVLEHQPEYKICIMLKNGMHCSFKVKVLADFLVCGAFHCAGMHVTNYSRAGKGIRWIASKVSDDFEQMIACRPVVDEGSRRHGEKQGCPIRG